jgi:DNA polymerase III delta subunit
MLTEDAQEHLLRATGGDLGLLAAEIAKLSGLQTSGPIDRDVVGEMVGVRFGETADDWRDAILRDHTGTAVTLTPRILELSGNSGVRLVTMLGASLLVLRWARVNFMKDKTRNRTRLIGQVQQLCFSTRPVVGAYQPFARLIGEVVGQWPERRLRSGLASALAADVALKSTTISDETGIITDLLFSLAITPTRADISFQQDFSGSNA